MRKYITLMLLLLSCIGAMAQQFSLVNNYQDFKEAVKNNKNIRLTANIDLTGAGFDMINVTYKGIIDGSGTDESGNPICHSLSGGENTKGSDKRAHKPIIKALEGATLQNIVIKNFRLEWDDDDIGAVACTAKNSKFINVMIANISVFNDDDDAGAIVGKAENCEFRNVMGINNDVTVDGNRAGGFVGLSYNSFYCICSNSAYSSVYADGSWGNAYAGGFVGDSNSDQFVFCINMAQIGALDDCVGGITGKSRKSHFSNCSNSGCIMHSKEADFINAISNMKKALENIDLTKIEEALEEQYKDQDFNFKAMAASFIGGLGSGVIGNAVGWMLALIESPAAPVVLTAAFVTIVAGAVAALVVYIDQELDAHDDVGGICGYCEGGSFSMCINYGNLICYDAAVGGIVGETDRERFGPTTITNCLNAGTIKGYDLVGGIFGEGDYGDMINHCLNVGEINNHQKSGKSDPIGNFNNKKDLGTLTMNYYKASAYNENKYDRIPVTSEMLENSSVLRLLNDGIESIETPWHQVSGDPYPVPADQSGKNETLLDFKNIDGVYIISSIADLDTLRTNVNNGKHTTYLVYISSDIDCNGVEWEPIGISEHPFMGICIGDGHTISNLKIADKYITKSGNGFFGYVGINTEVRDLIIGSGSIKGDHAVGAIIGYAQNSTDKEGFIKIIGCGNKANVTGDYDCGGLIGAIYTNANLKLTIENSFNMGTVTGNKQTAALCGYGKNNAEINSCWNTGKVTGTEKNKGFARGESDILVNNCYSLDTTFEQKGVSMFTAEDAKDGTLCCNLNGFSNDASVGLPWEQNIAPGGDSYPHYRDNNEGRAVYTDRIVSGTYGTVILPYAVQSNDSIRYYILESVTGDGNEAQFEFSAVDTLKAGTPAVFYFRGQKGSLYEFISICETFSKEPNDLEVDDWTMTGNLGRNDMVFTDQTYLESLYFISNGAVKNATQSLTVSPFRAYLKTTGPAPARTRAFFYDGGTLTSVQVVEADIEENVSKEGIFNLAGQPLGTIEKGFSIIDGKLYYFDE